MKPLFTKGSIAFVVVILLSGFSLRSQAQTFRTVESGARYTALAKDASNNIYVTRFNSGSSWYEIVRYTKGTGTPKIIMTGLLYGPEDYPLGLVVATNGDVYVASTKDNKVFKLTYNSGTDSYTPSTFLTGKHYCALAIDASDNIYTNENLDATHYSVVKYPAGSTTGTLLYGNISYGSGFFYPTGLAIASNGDIFFTDAFKNPNAGSVHRVTAASGYTTISTISSNNYATALALDNAGNLLCSEYIGSTYVLDKYTNATGTPTKLHDLLLTSVDFFPWGIVPLSTDDIYFLNGNDEAGSGGALLESIAAPATQSTNVSFSNIQTNTMTATLTKGNGAARAIFIKNTTSGSPSPVNSFTYTANSGYGSGTQIGASGWYCIYNGTGTTVNITGLTAGASYRVMSIEYNGAPGSENYLTSTATSNPNNALSPLPVTWLNFDINKENSVYTWGWKLGLEENVDYYTPQYSIDGVHFTDAGRLTTLNSNHTYRYSTSLPIAGNAFFRIMEVDLDGLTMYSSTRKLGSNASLPLSFYPNPAISEVSIQWPYADATSVNIVILNSAGKIVRQHNDIFSSPINISLSGLAPGTYFIYGLDDRKHVTTPQPILKVAN